MHECEHVGGAGLEGEVGDREDDAEFENGFAGVNESGKGEDSAESSDWVHEVPAEFDPLAADIPFCLEHDTEDSGGGDACDHEEHGGDEGSEDEE